LRILLAAHDVEPALDLLGALEDAGHRVEHVFDLEEALLRAAIAWPDAVVVDVGKDGVETPLLRRWVAEHEIPLVLTSKVASPPSTIRDGWASAAQQLSPPVARTHLDRMARRLHAVAFERVVIAQNEIGEPAWCAAFVDVVETAVRAAQSAPLDDDIGQGAGNAPALRKRSGTVEVSRLVLLAARGHNAIEVVSGLVRSSLGVRCVSARTAAEALGALHGEPRIKAVLLDRRLTVEAEGRDLHALIAERGIPVVPLRVPEDDEPAAVGRNAWEVIPPLRKALAARRARVG
jgi:DNA-binding NtrC family response regulator